MNDGALIDAIARVTATEDPTILNRLIHGLERGELNTAATAGALQMHLRLPMGRIDAVRGLLSTAASHTPQDLALLLRVSTATREHVQAPQTRVEIAATHPRLVPQVRTTGGVARDVIASATKSLLIVGYSVTNDQDMTGLASRTLAAMGEAGARGVKVNAVLHRKAANRAALLHAWPSGSPPPSLFTWPEQADDSMASMHAKVLVADRVDALVTSANLTYHGFEGNVEMGIRVSGAPATTVAKVFETLIRSGEFVEWRS